VPQQWQGLFLSSVAKTAVVLLVFFSPTRKALNKDNPLGVISGYQYTCNTSDTGVCYSLSMEQSQSQCLVPSICGGTVALVYRMALVGNGAGVKASSLLYW
jgi:hypothetical protein